MKIGYPCINLSLECRSSNTFRLASYNEERLYQTLSKNLACLQEILDFNVRQGLHFFRISSQLVPFASHPVCTYDWGKEFKNTFQQIGNYMKKHDLRISMHPDQFVLINSPSEEIFERSVAELAYHAKVLDLLELDSSHKIQIHVGGAYGDKEASIRRFIQRYALLPVPVRKRLVIENDDRLFSVQDCLKISKATHIPILLDTFHHEILHNSEDFRTIFKEVAKTWQNKDGLMVIDYSSQDPGKRKGNHIFSIDLKHFENFLKQVLGLDFDIMLEIKDKEKSALQALRLLQTKTFFLLNK